MFVVTDITSGPQKDILTLAKSSMGGLVKVVEYEETKISPLKFSARFLTRSLLFEALQICEGTLFNWGVGGGGGLSAYWKYLGKSTDKKTDLKIAAVLGKYILEWLILIFASFFLADCVENVKANISHTWQGVICSN